MLRLSATLMVLISSVHLSAGMGGIDGAVEGLFKKYGMMKIFEDCYGKETVQAWWEEMMEATQKCRNMSHDKQEVDSSEDNLISNKIQQAEEIRRKQAEEIRRKITQTAKIPQPIDLGETSGFYQSIIPQAPLYPQVSPLRVGLQDVFHTRPQVAAIQQPFYYISPSQGNFYYSLHTGIDGSRRQMRGMDLATARQIFQSRVDAKIGNVTCILRELNFLDDENHPNLDGIYARIMKLSLPDDVKRDMVDGVNMCSDFSKCVPLTKYDRLPSLRSLARPYMFFNCFKTQKLIACMKKDFREQYGVSVDDSHFSSHSRGFASLVDQSDEEAEVSMFSMIFGFSDHERP